jgi:hypothetical protein
MVSHVGLFDVFFIFEKKTDNYITNQTF